MRTVDLFAGCGGLSKGFENAGFDIIAAFEFWDKAADCYARNFNHPVLTTDLSDTAKAIEEIRGFNPDVIIGGPPCQDFSQAGKRVEASRASLTKSYAEIIHAIRPRFFVMENVDRAQKSQSFAQALEIFRDSGYGLTMLVLDACRCGAPQKRKRFFCIGGLGEADDFLKGALMNGLADKDMTLRDYFGESLDFTYYYRHPRNYSRRAIFSIDEPAPTMRGVNRPVPKGYPGHPNDAHPVDENIRALTTLERALIQTFPADYHWCGTKTDMEQMIGNAVPVKLAQYVAQNLLDYIENKVVYPQPIELQLHFAEASFCNSFKTWLMDCKELSTRTASDMVSRVKRADGILPMSGYSEGVVYISRLTKEKPYQQLSKSVQSQIKRAVSLYCEYTHKNLYELDKQSSAV